MCGCFPCMYVCLCGVCGGQKRMTPLEQELWTGWPPCGCKCWELNPGLLEEELTLLVTGLVPCSILHLWAYISVHGRLSDSQAGSKGQGGEQRRGPDVNSLPRWVCQLGWNSVSSWVPVSICETWARLDSDVTFLRSLMFLQDRTLFFIFNSGSYCVGWAVLNLMIHFLSVRYMDICHRTYLPLK